MQTRSIAFAFTFVAMGSSSAPLAGTDLPDCVQYEITKVVTGPICDDIIGGNADVFPEDMNDHGHVVGFYDCTVDASQHAFVWYGEGPITPIPVPPGTFESAAYGINNEGVVVGRVILADSQRGFRYDGETFELLPMPENATSLNALAINDAGDIVGYYTRNPPSGLAAFVIRNGEFLDLDGAPWNSHAQAIGINQVGEVVGWHAPGFPESFEHIAFHWDGAVTQLGPIPGGTDFEPRAINDSGIIVGRGHWPDGETRGYAWHEGDWTIAEPFDGQQQSSLYYIDATGVLFGGIGDPDPGRGAIWRGSRPFIFDDLVANLTALDLFGVHGSTIAGDLCLSARRPDLVQVFAILSPADPVPGDLTGDCVVGVPDLLRLLLA